VVDRLEEFERLEVGTRAREKARLAYALRMCRKRMTRGLLERLAQVAVVRKLRKDLGGSESTPKGGQTG